jgi:hypothetical protein
MTIAEMHQEFLVLIDKSNSLEYPDFLPEEIDLFLNKSQDQLVKNKFSGNNAKKESIEETQKRMDDLRNLIKNFNYIVPASVLSTASQKPNSRLIPLPTDYWFSLQDDIDITKSCGVVSNVWVKTISHDRYNRIMDDPFNKPGDDFVVKLFIDGNQVEIITSDSNATISNSITYHLRYLAKPTTMSLSNPTQNCVLADHIHREIIDLAVNMALEDISSDRFKTQIIETQRNE